MDLRGRARVWAKRGALGLAIAYATFLVLMNVALATGLVSRLISRKPEAILVRFDSAWSFWPGRVHARNLQIRGADSMCEWQLGLDDVTFRTSLVDLLRRRFHASHVRGQGVSMRMRFKLDLAVVTPEAVSVLAPIEGFADPPLKPKVPRPDIADADYHLWSVQLEDVEADAVKEVWIEAYRFVGDAHLTGNFVLKPLRLVMVGPIEAEVRRGTLHVGTETVMDGLTGHLDGTIVPFDPRVIEGAEFMHFLTLVVTGDGRLASLRFMNHYFPRPDQPKLDGGTGPAHVDVRLIGGVVRAPSNVVVDSQVATFTLADHRGTAAPHFTLAVEEKDGRTDGHVAIDLAQVDVTRGTAPVLRAAKLAFIGKSAKLDVVHGFDDAVVSADIPDAIVPDLHVIDGYLKDKDVSVRSGTAHVRAMLSSTPATHTAWGDVWIVADKVAIRNGELAGQGNATVAIKVTKFDYIAKTAELSACRVEARDVVTGGVPAGWWGRVDAEHVSIAYTSSPRVKAGVTFQTKDARPFLHAYAMSEQGIPGWTANRFTLSGLRGSAAISAGDSFVEVRSFRAAGGDFAFRAEIQKRAGLTNGIALITSGPFSTGIALKNGSPSVRLFGATEWYQTASGPPRVN